MTKKAILALEDGSIFRGIAIGVEGVTVGEVVFNTAMTGYQEILTDPSYAKQIVTLTYPHIGNTGTNSEDEESDSVWASGLVIRNLPPLASNFRNQLPLSVYLQSKNVIGIADIDTRRLTRILREKGAQNGCIMSGSNLSEATAIETARSFPGLKGMDLAQTVSTQSVYQWHEGSWSLDGGHRPAEREARWHVVAYDFGVKRNILRLLVDRGCKVTVVPAKTSASEVMDLAPDGVFLSNGPGDPEPCDYAIGAIQRLLETDTPIFGICLGHQLLSLASGAKTIKMKFGHHGANHPVLNLSDGTVSITSQNHGFAVDQASLSAQMEATHVSLFDGSLQGIERKDKAAFSFQGHPEASPGPHDLSSLFDRFIRMMQDVGAR